MAAMSRASPDRAMRIVRFRYLGRRRYGLLDGDGVRPLSTSPFRAFQQGRDLAGCVEDGVVFGRDEVVLLPPCEPGKYVGIGINYRATAEALGMAVPDEPVVYVRPPSCIIGDGDRIVLPADGDVVCEGELAAVIGRRGRDVAEGDVAAHVIGYTLTNDLMDVARFHKDKGNPSLAKGRDGFAPLGPCIATGLDLATAELVTSVNGERVQAGFARDMLFGVERCVSHISRFMTLEPGDVVALGCPPTPARIAPGDRIEIGCAPIGTLANEVAGAPRT
ncbi:5-oxopent-3-ene-1,2,5-tricarboxylate decarboxylase [Sphingomonas sp. Root50]|nr:5-oxopent-3-ene-1,2,5-tricarboxylate decarboxylase [Sphingomonas sp. Root1294]KQY68293.1 5-oxopent-3-ene-1,2,5-tricarboxylate decarboxylase [Sphingomonas sp. Root50]KRB91193.1 5-oxopent-3-ene-1,2,5-tricarboxylate decarboxylase [Sphingomonas sp. Root720]